MKSSWKLTFLNQPRTPSPNSLESQKRKKKSRSSSVSSSVGEGLTTSGSGFFIDQTKSPSLSNKRTGRKISNLDLKRHDECDENSLQYLLPPTPSSGTTPRSISPVSSSTTDFLTTSPQLMSVSPKSSFIKLGSGKNKVIYNLVFRTIINTVC